MAALPFHHIYRTHITHFAKRFGHGPHEHLARIAIITTTLLERLRDLPLLIGGSSLDMERHVEDPQHQ